jgi:N-acetylglucosaminyldiphosphoundecaprenol N-acetyl-beta-D-mannosaminyltransferase
MTALASPSIPAERPPFLGVSFSPLTRSEIVRSVLAGVAPEAPCRLIVTANTDHVVRLSTNPAFRRAYAAAWASTVDGAPVALACRLAGVPIPGRITGADLFVDVMRGLDPARHRPVFVVADRHIAERLAQRLHRARLRSDRFRIEVPPRGFEHEPAAAETVLRAVEAIAATHLFMGIGAPRSEIFVASHRHRLRGVVAMCVGAGIAYHLGIQRRAPAVLRRAGLEWSWRLLAEPHRLGRRYLVDSWVFTRLLTRELLQRRVRPGSRTPPTVPAGHELPPPPTR